MYFERAMEAAANNGHIHIVRLCWEYGVGAKSIHNALQIAARKGHEKCAVWLYNRLLAHDS